MYESGVLEHDGWNEDEGGGGGSGGISPLLLFCCNGVPLLLSSARSTGFGGGCGGVLESKPEDVARGLGGGVGYDLDKSVL